MTEIDPILQHRTALKVSHQDLLIENFVNAMVGEDDRRSAYQRGLTTKVYDRLIRKAMAETGCVMARLSSQRPEWSEVEEVVNQACRETQLSEASSSVGNRWIEITKRNILAAIRPLWGLE